MKPTPRRIIANVCRLMHVNFNELITGRRGKMHTRARTVAAGLAREWTCDSYPDIASALGMGSHMSALEADRRWMCMSERDRDGWRWRIRMALGMGTEDGLSGLLANKARRELPAIADAWERRMRRRKAA